ncbi:MAG: hypothetical protein IPK82_04680 [Polyangiaceae bacterium]|nr:hypothetical protein [Polyangiaceae bacterium]
MLNVVEEAEAELRAAEEDVSRLRAQNAELANDFRTEPTEDKKEGLRRAAQSLSAARDRVEAAKARLEMVKKTGSPYGVVALAGRVVGTVAVLLNPGTSRAEREKQLDLALAEPLAAAAEELGLVISASPSRFVRERPGRDADGKTVFDVAGRAEGDVLVPGNARSVRGN